MLFHSHTFVFAFLPAVWLIYALVLRFFPILANPVLILASLLFYGWWDARFVPLLIGSVVFNFLVGRQLESTRSGMQTVWLTVGIIANLGLLGFFKYANFFLQNVAAIGGFDLPVLAVILPIGISFFTFQQIAYLADVAKGDSGHYRLTDYSVFVSFFPQLIAGPIVHHREMMPQFAGRRKLAANDVALGLSIFIVGLFKKVVIADHLALFATSVFAAADAGEPLTLFEAWGGALAYTFQIYFDFSGYCDMAIGLARMFGIRIPINFHSPYKARSIIDFWRRWHMTLSRFLRDYLYIPLGGNRKGPARRTVNLMITMLLGGLWHGAGWGFVLWGLLHGVFLMINHGFRTVRNRRGRAGRMPAGSMLSVGLTFLCVVFAWVFFRAETLAGAMAMASAMAGGQGLTVPADFVRALGDLPEHLGLSYAHSSHVSFGRWMSIGLPIIVMAAAICWMAPNTNQIFLSGDKFYPGVSAPKAPVLAWQPSAGVAVAVSALFLGALFFASTTSEFLYFQF